MKAVSCCQTTAWRFYRPTWVVSATRSIERLWIGANDCTSELAKVKSIGQFQWSPLDISSDNPLEEWQSFGQCNWQMKSVGKCHWKSVGTCHSSPRWFPRCRFLARNPLARTSEAGGSHGLWRGLSCFQKATMKLDIWMFLRIWNNTEQPISYRIVWWDLSFRYSFGPPRNSFISGILSDPPETFLAEFFRTPWNTFILCVSGIL